MPAAVRADGRINADVVKKEPKDTGDNQTDERGEYDRCHSFLFSAGLAGGLMVRKAFHCKAAFKRYASLTPAFSN